MGYGSGPLATQGHKRGKVALRMLDIAAGQTYKYSRVTKMHKEENGRRGDIEGR
jgi:hypothetical protein